MLVLRIGKWNNFLLHIFRSNTPSAAHPSVVSPPQTPASAPPRPPKKAELAGNPLNQSLRGSMATDSSHKNISSPPQSPMKEQSQDGGQSTSPADGRPPLELSAAGLMMPPGNMVTPLNMDEQLKLLQQQHQLQMQSLGMVPPPVGNQPEASVHSGGTSGDIGPMTSLPAVGSNFSAVSMTEGVVPYVNPLGSFSQAGAGSSQVSSRGSSEPPRRSIGSPLHLPNISSAPLLDTSSEDPNQEMEHSKEEKAIMDLQLLLQPPNELPEGLTPPLNPESVQDSTTSSSISLVIGGSEVKNELDKMSTQSLVSPPHFTPIASCWTPTDTQPGVSAPSTVDSSVSHLSLPNNSLQTEQGGSGSGTTAYAPVTDTASQASSPSRTDMLPQATVYVSSVNSSIVDQSTLGNLGRAAEMTSTINSISRPIPAPVVSPPTSPRDSKEPEESLSANDLSTSPQPPLSTSVDVVPSDATKGLENPVHQDTCRSEHLKPAEVNEDNAGLKTSEDILEMRNTVLSRDSTPHLPELQSDLDGEIRTELSSLSSMMPLTSSVIAPLSGIELTSNAVDTELHSLPQLSDFTYRTTTLSSLVPLSLQTPSSISPISLDAGTSLSVGGTSQLAGHAEHLQALLASNKTMQLTVDEKSREIEQSRATIADQKSQLENYKQQLLILQQQLSQVSVQQQKQEQEKATASGQQAVLMQLLQQQQGMFSQQQAQIEKLSKATEIYRQERVDVESKHKQALSVEQERCAGLTSQNFQVNQEIHKLQHQIQSINQQQQVAQLQLYQLQGQVQERDKHLLSFREQHKQIIQNLEQRHQQKMAQMVQQIQDLQAELKRAKSQKLPPRNLQSPSTPSRDMQQSIGGTKGNSYSPHPPQQTAPLLPPISMPKQAQEGSPAFMPPKNSPGNTSAGGLQRNQLDILTPVSARTSPSAIQQQHQVASIQPTKVQSPQLPPIGNPQAQLVNPQLPSPMKLQLSDGFQQQGPGSSSSLPTPDAASRNLSWNIRPQQQTQVPFSQENQSFPRGTGIPGQVMPPHSAAGQQQQQNQRIHPQQQQQQQQQQQDLQQSLQQPSQQSLSTGLQQQQLPFSQRMMSQGSQQQHQQGLQQQQQGMQQPQQGMQQQQQGIQQHQQGMQQQQQGIQQHQQGMQQHPQRVQQQQQRMPQHQPGMQQKQHHLHENASQQMFQNPQQQLPSQHLQQGQQNPPGIMQAQKLPQQEMQPGQPRMQNQPAQPLLPQPHQLPEQQQRPPHMAATASNHPMSSQPSLQSVQSTPHSSIAAANPFQIQGRLSSVLLFLLIVVESILKKSFLFLFTSRELLYHQKYTKLIYKCFLLY